MFYAVTSFIPPIAPRPGDVILLRRVVAMKNTPRSLAWIALALSFFLEMVWGQSTCRLVNLSLVKHCGTWIDEAWADQHSVLESFNESEADELAVLFSSGNPCPFFNVLEFQCAKYFMRCKLTGESYLTQMMCVEVCERYKTWEGGLCAKLSDAECLEPFYGTPPDCFVISYGEEHEDKTWQYILGGSVASVGFGLAASLIYRYYKDKTWKPDPNAPVEFEDEAKLKKKRPKTEGPGGFLPLSEVEPTDDSFRTAQQARAEALQNQSATVSFHPSAAL
eukprot:g3660.t1